MRDNNLENIIKIAQEKPEHVPSQLALMQYLDASRQFQACAQVAQRVLALHPGNVLALRQMLRCYIEFNMFEKAIDLAEKILAQLPDDGATKLFLAQAMVKSGQVKRGVTILKEMCEHSDLGLYSAFPTLAQFAPLVKDDISFLVQRLEPLLEKEVQASEAGQVSILLFAVARYLAESDAHKASLPWLAKANKLHRSSYRYTHADSISEFQDIKSKYNASWAEKHVSNDEIDEDSLLTPIFVLGMPRSGTTLVEQILSSHELVKGCGELGLVENIISEMKDEIDPAYFGDRYLEVLKDAFGDFAYMTDKMPNNFKHIGLIAAAMPHAKIIHCKRSPLETCISIYKQQFKGAHQYAYDQSELVAYYKLYEELMAYWEALLPANRVYSISYESLVSNTEEEIRKLLEHCDLEFDSRCLEFHKNDRAVATSSTAQVRQKIYDRSLEMSKKYGDFFSVMAAEL